jgi:hypothetical protein
LHEFDNVAVRVGDKSDLLAGAPGERPAIRLYVHRGEVFERLGQIVYEQAKVKVPDRVLRLFNSLLAVGEKLDTLTLREFQEHQLWSFPFRLCMKKFFRAERISIPADAALYIGDLESDMPESNSSDSHS